MSCKKIKLWTVGVLLLVSETGLSWGERGHDIVARVSSRLIAAKQESTLPAPFTIKEHMMGHLANVPDIVWRSERMPASVRNMNSPTHFINFDKLYDKCDYKSLNTSLSHNAKLATSKKTNLYIEVGTAPWRIQQLYTEMVKNFKAAKAAGTNEKKMVEAVNEALLYGGIMAHFVGDLANPMHTTGDYDGWETEQGGLHKYFETDIVDAMLLSLINDVYVYGLMKKPFESRLGRVMGDDAKGGAEFGLKAAFALVCDSHAELAKLRKIDKKFSLETRSRKVGISKVQAERKSPGSVKKHYKWLVVERLALGAATLSEIWYQAWIAGGKPDMSAYESYDYPVEPKFIEPNYVPAKISKLQQDKK